MQRDEVDKKTRGKGTDRQVCCRGAQNKELDPASPRVPEEVKMSFRNFPKESSWGTGVSSRGAGKERIWEVSELGAGILEPRGPSPGWDCGSEAAPWAAAGRCLKLSRTQCPLSVKWAWQSTSIRTGVTESRWKGHPLFPLPSSRWPIWKLLPGDGELSLVPGTHGAPLTTILKSAS